MSVAQPIRSPGARRALAGLVVALSALAPASRADVLEVGPAAEYADPASAVAAAADGDVILVAPGTYAGFDIDGKALTVVGDSNDGPVVFSTRVTVRNLAPGSLVVLQGFSNPMFGSSPMGLDVVDCAGQVLVDSVDLRAQNGLLEAPSAVSVRFSDAVTLSNSSFRGGNGAFCTEDFCTGNETLGAAGSGVQVRSSTVAVEHCTLVGGQGGSWDFAEPVSGGSGGAALNVLGQGAFVHVAGSVLDGGDGGFGDCSLLFCGSDGGGGAAVRLFGETGFVSVRDCELLPGLPAGSATPTSEFHSFTGGTIVTSSTPAAAVVAQSPVRSGDDVLLELSGEPGAAASLWISGFAGFFHLPGREGVFHLGFPLALPKPVALGALPGSGATQLVLPVPELPGLPAINVHVQLVTAGVSGARLGGPAVIVVLDETP